MILQVAPDLVSSHTFTTPILMVIVSAAMGWAIVKLTIKQHTAKIEKLIAAQEDHEKRIQYNESKQSNSNCAVHNTKMAAFETRVSNLETNFVKLSDILEKIAVSIQTIEKAYVGVSKDIEFISRNIEDLKNK